MEIVIKSAADSRMGVEMVVLNALKAVIRPS